MTFDRDKMKSTLSAMAAQGAFLGTSSWKYPVWLEQLYKRDRDGRICQQVRGWFQSFF